MTTLPTRARVSLAVLLAAAGLAACAPAARHAAPAPAAPAPAAGPLAIRFVNEAREHVHVYLIGDRREWMLGRVEPGARATLRIPAAAREAAGGAFVQLGVVTGERRTLWAARDARARLSLPQPAAVLPTQQWVFGQGQLTPWRLPDARPAAAGAGRP